MTRSDLMLTVKKRDDLTNGQKNELILLMHRKIESVYRLLFEFEKREAYADLGEKLRELLEANYKEKQWLKQILRLS